jgi:uncharacterized protein YegJ (DUF2314 family)
MALSWRGWRKRNSDPTDPVMAVTESDQDINLAIGRARSTLDVFFKQLANQKPNQEGFLVKVRFSHGADVEHIWLADLAITNRQMHGVIASEPRLPGLSFMKSVSFKKDQITDWMYIEDKCLVGGFTTRVLRARMSPDELDALNANLPYRIEDYQG